MAEDFRTLLMENGPLRRRGPLVRGHSNRRLVLFFRPGRPVPRMPAPRNCCPAPWATNPLTCACKASAASSATAVTGAWEQLQHKPWAALFSQEGPTVMHAPDVPVATCQQIYEDLLAFARSHPLP